MDGERVDRGRGAGRRSIERWENEGGAIRHPRVRSKTRNEDSAEMARPVLDGLADGSATVDEQESRKRKLLKGPKEFRDIRRDHRR